MYGNEMHEHDYMLMWRCGFEDTTYITAGEGWHACVWGEREILMKGLNGDKGSGPEN